MKAFRNYFPGLSAMLMSIALVCSCSSEDDVVVAPATPFVPEKATIHFSTQLGPKGGTASQAKAITLSLDDDGSKAKGPKRVIAQPGENDKVLTTSWAVGEKVALVYNYYFPRIVEATVTSVINGNATIEGVLPVRPADNTAVKIVYPYDAVEEYTPTTRETAGEIKPDYIKTGQDGTIATISQKYDIAVGYGNLSVASDSYEASLKEKVDLQNQYAILRMKFTDSEGEDITGITTLTLTNTSASPETKIVSLSDLNTEGYIYVVMEPVSTATTIRFTAANDENIYEGTATLNLLESSKYYRATLGLPSKEENRWVDLGLSVKWAKWNVGATKPEEYGDYFAWGETEPHYTEGNAQNTATTGIWKTSPIDYSDGYSEENYFDIDRDDYNPPHVRSFLTYYPTALGEGLETLKPEHDAATVNWGSSWRMPTDSEITELKSRYMYYYDGMNLDDYPALKGVCKFIEDYKGSGVSGLAFYRKNNLNKVVLFLPFGGHRGGTSGLLNRINNVGEYWSKDVTGSNTGGFDLVTNTPCLIMYKRYYNPESRCRWDGLLVRPVYAP